MRKYIKKMHRIKLDYIHRDFVLADQDDQIYNNLMRMASLISAKYGYDKSEAYTIANDISYELLAFRFAKRVAAYSDERFLDIADNYFKYRH